jgi:hypothetical protein
MGDVVVLNDPLTGQGSNNASRCAEDYLASILSHVNRPFDREFMQNTFERYWDYSRFVTSWTNFMLAPPPPHVIELLGAAGTRKEIAHRFVDGFDNPRDFASWFTDPVLARKYLDDLVPRS